jgi:Fe-S-cluster-containing hydrogenase component 2
MSDPKVFAIADQAIVDPITIVPELCTGCNLCSHVCPVDLFLPNHDKGGPPHVLYPASAGTKAVVWTCARNQAPSA